VIRAEHLSKIFGPDPTSALERLEQGQSKDAIRESSGHVVGVDDVSFRLKPGEFFVIMGLSGSGKSTLLRCLNRLIEPPPATSG
jgi:glycine betaine/proline transport system ATP-binding protein